MKKKSLVSRALWALGKVILGLLLASVGVVLLFRFVPVPYSAFMMERQVEAWRSGRSYRAQHRWTPLERIAPEMGVAVIAAEDQNFEEHFGFDWQAIEKAYVHNEHSRKKRGASTVSQQTAKNLFLWESRSWARKGCEVYFTLLLETLWSKRRILEVYLNTAEFGDGVYGVEAASRKYFGHSAERLGPGQAALLAAVLPSPRRYRADAPSPYLRSRQEWILRQMQLIGGEQVVRNLAR
jgi:monofunctional biosynthetic peptidoglycan transglycosylase